MQTRQLLKQERNSGLKQNNKLSSTTLDTKSNSTFTHNTHPHNASQIWQHP